MSLLKRTARPDHSQAPKRAKLLDDDSDDAEQDNVLEVNEEYAARFKHNKERADLHRLEAKFGAARHGDDESSTDDGTEDEDGELVNENVDLEIAATLDAIRSKDPRIYSNDSKFYSNDGAAVKAASSSKSEAVYLRDYHRQNLLQNGGALVEDDQPVTYNQEQKSLKASILRDINAAAVAEAGNESENDDFLVKKERKAPAAAVRPPVLDPHTADKDPDTYLSNFFAARAWVPTDRSEYQPLESDDEEEDARAEELEFAWNLRFEDPETSNQTLTTHSRDIVAKYSVRRDEPKGRKRLREIEKEQKQQEKLEREEEKKRYKNLKIREMEEKLDKIREAAGLHGKDIKIEEWTDLLEADWEDDGWNDEMARRFGEQYYQENDDRDQVQDKGSAKKPRKPQWDDDIDIQDLDPEFDEQDDVPEEILSEEESEQVKRVSKKAQRAKDKSAARRDRRIIEALADRDIPLSLGQSDKSFQPFRYRDTSPNAFGLTPLDILAASDAQLNEFAGLKKLATFRDAERKKLDKKKLSKKARLRAWRKETFGREEGPELASITQPQALGEIHASAAGQEALELSTELPLPSVKDKSKRKRKRKSKTAG